MPPPSTTPPRPPPDEVSAHRSPLRRPWPRRRFWTLVVVATWASIAALTLVPVPRMSAPAPPGFDKLVHVALWAVATGTLWLLLVRGLRWARGRASVVALAAGALFGVAVEGLQGLTAYRSADPLDLLADVLGAALAVAALYATRR